MRAESHSEFCSTTPSQPFRERREVASVDLTIDLRQEVSASLARSEVLPHLLIPSAFLHLFDPVCNLLAFLFVEVNDCVLDRFNGHNPTISLVALRRKIVPYVKNYDALAPDARYA